MSPAIKYKDVIPHEFSTKALKKYFASSPPKFMIEDISGIVFKVFESEVPVLLTRWDKFEVIIADEVGWDIV